MDDIVVIILTLIVALFGVLNKKKKKTPGGTTQGAQSESNNIWDLIMNGDNEPEESLQEFAEPVAVAKENENIEEKQKFGFSAQNEGVSVFKPEKTEAIKETKATLKRRKKVLIEGEEFSLRKAIIYSEIMNRKYS